MLTDKLKSKLLFAVAGLMFFGGLVVWTTVYGVAANSLHVSAQSWSPAPRTGISQGAKVGIGAGAVGIATQGWEAVTQAPETLLQAMLGALHKPAFWVFVVVIAAGVYVWHRRKQMKAAS